MINKGPNLKKQLGGALQKPLAAPVMLYYGRMFSGNVEDKPFPHVFCFTSVYLVKNDMLSI